MNQPQAPASLAADPLLTLLGLIRRAREAGSVAELRFIAVNDSLALAPYRQAVLWFEGRGVQALSGVVQLEANAPYVHWLGSVCAELQARGAQAPLAFMAADLPADLAAAWQDWWPAHALWLPLPAGDDEPAGGLLLAGDSGWTSAELALLTDWTQAWLHAWRAREGGRGWHWTRVRAGLARASAAGRPWWRRPWVLAGLAAVLVLACPVRLSVLAPGELVPAHPAVIRAPLEGVIGQFHVQPNDKVKAGQPLFSFDEAALAARRDVAAQALDVAQAEYRQFAQQALSDAKSKSQLAQLLGRIEEKRAEAGYLAQQLERARVVAPQDGEALFDDPADWIGKPVQTGERVMRIAAPGDVEVEAWLPLGDAIDAAPGAPVTLYLAASPLHSVAARLRYISHEAQLRPNGVYAYRARAQLDQASALRVGLKGTAKLEGDWVPLGYWLVRRPWSVVRQALGF